MSTDSVIRRFVSMMKKSARYSPSRINPAASEAPRTIKFINDMDRGHFVANLYLLATDASKKVEKITLRATTEGYNLLIYGITF